MSQSYETEGPEDIGCRIGKPCLKAKKQKAMGWNMAWEQTKKAVKDQVRTINSVSPECGRLLKEKRFP